jgi:hypothetical protein
MDGASLWLVAMNSAGDEIGRSAIDDSADRGVLPLRWLAQEGLRCSAAALILIRHARDATCTIDSSEHAAINRAKATLGAIGLQLHDYILWHGAHSVSLRQTGQL